MACRIARTSEWTTRILHELIGKDGCFVTLTYNNESLPQGETLVKEHLQIFIRELRRGLYPKKIKYYACGEYGDTTQRPHYHAIIIGWKPELEQCYTPDKKQVVSKEIEALWTYGHNTVGTPDREAIQYVVGYIRKKLYGSKSEDYGTRLPPFPIQSQGIGLNYCMSHYKEILNRGITRNGKQVGIPRYYKKKLVDQEVVNEEYFQLEASIHSFEEKRTYLGDRIDPEVVPLVFENDARVNVLQHTDETLDYLDRLHDYLALKKADEDRRKKDLEARETLFKKGKL
jgi:hypothetical protein